MHPHLRLRRAGLRCATAMALAAAMPRPALEFTAAAELVLPGIASSEYSEIRLTSSPDGATLLWGSTNRPGGAGGWDIWRTRRTAAGWSAPAAVSFDSPFNDFDPAFTADGRFVYFFSNRPGGLGGDDLYRVRVSGDGFGRPENLGPNVNTPKDEWAPSLSADGKLLLFATDGRGGAGRHDLFTARVEGAGFAAARPLPGAVNTPEDDFDATFLPDGASIVFSRAKNVETAPVALYVARLGTTGYDAGTRLPASVNVDGGDALAPLVDAADAGVLFFTSHRPEANAGKADLYRIRFRLRR